jgi:hypothetical protein
VDADEYIKLVDKGTSVKYDKIRSDSFRTFPDEKVNKRRRPAPSCTHQPPRAHQQDFRDRVSESAIIRVLNSFVQQYGRLRALTRSREKTAHANMRSQRKSRICRA